MKAAILIGMISLLALWSCQKDNELISGDTNLSGTISKQGITTYQYGTHVLNTGDSVFALKSNSIDLDLYISKPVTVSAKRIDGYPVENGPVFLEVVSVNTR